MSHSPAEAPFAGLRLLTKADILKASDLASEMVPTPEWEEGTAVRVLALDVNRRQMYFEFTSTVTRDETGLRFDTKPYVPYDAALAVLSIVDDKDQPYFTLDEIDVLGTKSPEVISRIADVARRLSKMRAEDREEAKAALNPTNGASPSASPAISE